MQLAGPELSMLVGDREGALGGGLGTNGLHSVEQETNTPPSLPFSALDINLEGALCFARRDTGGSVKSRRRLCSHSSATSAFSFPGTEIALCNIIICWTTSHTRPTLMTIQALSALSPPIQDAVRCFGTDAARYGDMYRVGRDI